jgi:putative membrane protein
MFESRLANGGRYWQRRGRNDSIWSYTDPTRRRYWLAVALGVVTGIIGGVIKLGWEVPFPPRTPARNVTNPPQELMQQLGFSYDFTHATYTYNGNQVQYVSLLAHFGFSIFFGGLVYCLAAEIYPQIKLWQGVAYGLVIWFAWHIVIMPALGTIPAPWDQPWQEWFSEITGHAMWLWVIELTRRDLRNRWIRLPDAEVALDAPFR